MEETGCLPEMVTARIRGEFQNADPGRARSKRLSTRCVSRFRSIHDAASAVGAVEDVVFPGRWSLGAYAAAQPALVANRERLGRSMLQVTQASYPVSFDMHF